MIAAAAGASVIAVDVSQGALDLARAHGAAHALAAEDRADVAGEPGNGASTPGVTVIRPASGTSGQPSAGG
jgi:D-arabinose 1-dehydrogenase-like Zn-dependent alcohol dehydrogenase